MPSLTEWGTFCEVLGSAAAALTGLQFVTVALLADIPMRDPGEVDAGDAFATPTIVHFITSLFLAAVLAAPWHRIAPPATLWGLAGLTGLIYTLIVIRRMRSQRSYQPVFEDWLFHAILPLLAYLTLAVSAPTVRFQPVNSVFAVAFAALLLLFIGVHNAWDNVTYLALRKRKEKQA
jgi:hypothetical protein